MAFWMMGELSTPPQRIVSLILRFGFFLAAGTIYTTASDLNLLLAGEKEAMHLGVDVRRVRLVVYIAASLLNGLAVSVSGAIGYVGLLVAPHVMRLLFGSRSPHPFADGRVRRRHRCSRRRYSRAHRGFSRGTTRRRHDRHRWRAAFSLFNAQEAGVTSYARSSPSAKSRPIGDAGDFNSDIRLSVEQVSYASLRQSKPSAFYSRSRPHAFRRVPAKSSRLWGRTPAANPLC